MENGGHGGGDVHPPSVDVGAATMEDRIRFIVHQGKSILLCDLSNCSAAEVKRIAELVPKFVTTHPKGSLLLLADFTGAEFDRNAFETMKEGAVFDRPHIKKSAWVGLDNLPKVFYENLKVFSRRDLPTFPTREEALDWLVKEE
ncbi:MAG TPA: STAS/SEC14 domain-containing protein [Terriglobales bacterium]|nr:STAS/SEC14 domain-containing protein [Terriglobales bacterium]